MLNTVEIKTPSMVLQSFIENYQITPSFLSKEIKLSYQVILNILKGKAKITVPIAIQLGAYFGNTPFFWLDKQISSEIMELSSNKKFLALIKKIPRAVRPRGKVKKAEVKSTKRKSNTISEKRKKAAKVPGAKTARGKKPAKVSGAKAARGKKSAKVRSR